MIGRDIRAKVRDDLLGAFYELMRNPTITVYTLKDGLEHRHSATDLPVSFGDST